MTSTQPQSRTVGPVNPRLAADPGTLRVPDAEDFGTTTRPVISTGEARIDVNGDDDVIREFFARVDFGAWRGPLVATDGVIVVRDSKLRLSGAHEIWLRSRIAGAPNTLEPADEATSVTVFVDGLAPQVRLERQGDVVVAIGHDDVTVAVDLEYAWQLDDGELGPFGALDRLPLDQLEARRVRVVAKDQAGHMSKPSAIDVVIERRRQRQDRELRLAADAGCAQTSTDTSAVLCALALGCLVRRRRRPTVRNSTRAPTVAPGARARQGPLGGRAPDVVV
jgi:hypothetical protein